MENEDSDSVGESPSRISTMASSCLLFVKSGVGTGYGDSSPIRFTGKPTLARNMSVSTRHSSAEVAFDNKRRSSSTRAIVNSGAAIGTSSSSLLSLAGTSLSVCDCSDNELSRFKPLPFTRPLIACPVLLTECNDSLDWLNGLPRLDCREGGASLIGSPLEASKGDAVLREATTLGALVRERDSGMAKLSRVGDPGVAGGETGTIDSIGRGGRGGVAIMNPGLDPTAGIEDCANDDGCP